MVVGAGGLGRNTVIPGYLTVETVESRLRREPHSGFGEGSAPRIIPAPRPGIVSDCRSGAGRYARYTLTRSSVEPKATHCRDTLYPGVGDSGVLRGSGCVKLTYCDKALAVLGDFAR